MATEVKVKQVEPVTVAFVAKKGSYSQIPLAFPDLYAWIAQQGYVPSGPRMGAYYQPPGQVPEEELVWEIQSPIVGDVAPCEPDEEGLGVKGVEGGEVAFALHEGPFDQVGAVWEVVKEWIAHNGYEIAGPGQEVYLSDPSNVRPEDLMTEVRFPVKKR